MTSGRKRSGTGFAYATEGELRAALIAEGIPLLDGVRLMLVDIENARTKTFGPIDAANENFYLLTLPRCPADRQPIRRKQTTSGTKLGKGRGTTPSSTATACRKAAARKMAAAVKAGRSSAAVVFALAAHLPFTSRSRPPP
jgi:hypothetical protein